MIRKRAATIVSVQALAAPGHFVLTFDDPETARDARPGHFIAVGATTPANPGSSILRKPFSIFTVNREAGLCSLLFSVYGPTTRTMAQYEAGDKLDFLGPLGYRYFLMSRQHPDGKFPGVDSVWLRETGREDMDFRDAKAAQSELLQRIAATLA